MIMKMSLFTFHTNKTYEVWLSFPVHYMPLLVHYMPLLVHYTFVNTGLTFKYTKMFFNLW